MAVTQTTCYRHSDRPTGLSCTECGRPICGECALPGPVGQRCPECYVPERPARRPAVSRSGLPPVSRALLFGTVAISFLAFALSGWQVSLAQANAAVAEGEWWRLLTAALVHADFIHLGVNMYALYLLAPTLERSIVGGRGLAATYVASVAAGGAFAFLFLRPDAFAVGASGGISGLIGVFVAFALARRIEPLLRQLGIVIAINVALPFLIPNIAWQAHVGGFLAGLVIAGGAFLASGDRQERVLLVGAVAVTAASILAVF